MLSCAAFPLVLETGFFFELWKHLRKEESWLLSFACSSCDKNIGLQDAMSCPQYRKWLNIDWRCTSCVLILLYSSQDVNLLLLPRLPLPPSSPPPSSITWVYIGVLSSSSWPGLSRFGLAQTVACDDDSWVKTLARIQLIAIVFTDQNIWILLKYNYGIFDDFLL